MMKKIACLGAMIAACAAFASTYTWIGGASGNLATASNWSPVPSGAFTSTDELVIETPAEITLDASATVGKITLSTTGGTQFTASGSGITLNVANIENAGSGTVTFACPNTRQDSPLPAVRPDGGSGSGEGHGDRGGRARG